MREMAHFVCKSRRCAMLKLREPGEREVLAAKMLTDEYIQRLAFLRVCVWASRGPCATHRDDRGWKYSGRRMLTHLVSLSRSRTCFLSPQGPPPHSLTLFCLSLSLNIIAITPFASTNNFLVRRHLFCYEKSLLVKHQSCLPCKAKHIFFGSPDSKILLRKQTEQK